jgi:Tfp pilus assembly protein PilN
MIKVNLYPGKKPVNLTKIYGFDLLKIKWIPLFVGILLIYMPESFVLEYYTGAAQDITKEQERLDNEAKELEQKVEESKKIQQQVDALKEQEGKLAAKLGLIKNIFDERKNPFNLLIYIAKNIPDDVWLDELILDQDNLEVKGQSYNYKSIGLFIENLKSSVFLKSDISFSQPANTTNDSNEKIEKFIIKSKIGKFE